MTGAFSDFIASLGSDNPPIPAWACAPVLATWREIERGMPEPPEPAVYADGARVVMGWWTNGAELDVEHEQDGYREWFCRLEDGTYDGGDGPLTETFFAALRRL